MYLFKKIPKKLKIAFILIILLFLYVYICASNYVFAISNDLSKNLLRLHIIANSDSKEDQELKYKVRDNIINYMNSICANINSKEEALSILNGHLDDFRQIALNTIKENGFNYDVSVEISNVYFPTKNYGDISLPEGNYDALRIKIGNSNGHNWWCVMFPPLCFVDITSGIVPDESKSYMKENLSDEEYNLLTSNTSSNNDISFKFKLVEFFNHNNLIIAKR